MTDTDTNPIFLTFEEAIRAAPQDKFDAWMASLRANADKQIAGGVFHPDGCMCAVGALAAANGHDYESWCDLIQWGGPTYRHLLPSLLGLDEAVVDDMYARIYSLNDSRLTPRGINMTFPEIADHLEKLRAS